MSHPLVSVITPTYNHERFVGDCIESVLAQSYPNWEMIIVDDGSTDGTPGVIATYSDPRIRYFHQENKGIWRLHETYNFALNQARGSLIAVLEGDDSWLPVRLERQVPFFRDTGVVLVFGRNYTMNEDGQELGLYQIPLPRLAPQLLNRPTGTALQAMLSEHYIVACTVLMDRGALERIGGFQQPSNLPAVDYATCLNMALQGEFRFIDEPLGYWRRHRGQSTALLSVQQATGAAKYALEFLKHLDPEIKDRARWTESRLVKGFDHKVANAHFQAGRYSLLAGERAAARRHFLATIQRGSVRARLKAAVGCMASFTGFSLEPLARITGRTTFE